MTDTLSEGSRNRCALHAVSRANSLVGGNNETVDDPNEQLLTVIAHVGRAAGIEWVRRYHRLTVNICHELPDEPSLIVSNHGFGAALDLNVFALMSVLDEISDRPITYLTHQMAWTLHAHHLLERVGCVQATADNAKRAIAAGHHVVVFPGGDIEAAKPHSRRNEIVFSNRTGFAELALELRTPIVPIVTAGAGDTLLVLHDGQPIAKALRLDRLLRCKAIPVSISIPWGLNVGLVGLVPYLPLPAQLTTSVLPPIVPSPDDTAADLAARTIQDMSDELATLAAI